MPTLPNEPRYVCLKCGTVWLAPYLQPVWGNNADECQGTMQLIEPPPPPPSQPVEQPYAAS